MQVLELGEKKFVFLLFQVTKRLCCRCKYETLSPWKTPEPCYLIREQ